MNGSTQIAYEKVRSDVDTIKQCANTMKNIFNDFNGSMEKVGSSDSFAGKASDALRAKYSSLKSKFEDYVNLVNYFGDIVLSAAAATEATEKKIEEEAGNLAS